MLYDVLLLEDYNKAALYFVVALLIMLSQHKHYNCVLNTCASGLWKVVQPKRHWLYRFLLYVKKVKL